MWYFLKVTEYGTPRGKFATNPKYRFFQAFLSVFTFKVKNARKRLFFKRFCGEKKTQQNKDIIVLIEKIKK